MPTSLNFADAGWDEENPARPINRADGTQTRTGPGQTVLYAGGARQPETPGMQTMAPPPGSQPILRTGPAPAPAPEPASPPDREITPAEAAAQGLGWVDRNHPLYGTPGYVGSKPAAPAGGGGGGTPAGGGGSAPAAGNVADQAKNASTYSATPGAAPTGPTTNQGTQDVVRNSYLAQATQGTNVTRDDPAVRMQSDAFRANVDRAARNHIADVAERQGPLASGAVAGEARLARERAGQAAGSFEAQLVGRELQNRRAEIQAALAGLTGQITEDQKQQLARDLAEIDAQVQRLGINTSASTASAQQRLQDKLGTAGLNLDQMRMLLQNQQFNKQFGLDVGDREAFWNNQALQSLF